MAYDAHQRAAEFHNLAAHAHSAVAVAHEKGDHLSGHELSRQAMEHANNAHFWSQKAHGESGKFAGKS
jgi:hypothetical protein